MKNITALGVLLGAVSVVAHAGSFDGIPRLGRRTGSGVELHELFGRQDPKFTTDGTCGNAVAGAGKGMRCLEDDGKNENLCCSAKGYCGDTDDHCGAGCQKEFGKCKEGVTSGERVTECGPTKGGAKCSDDECCSPSGFCGKDTTYCKSPDCQLGFGRCDASITPSGDDTSSVDRAQVGDVPYSTDIYHCNNAGEIALTFDDGPYKYTDAILDLLDKYKAKATFFVTGVNLGKGAIDDPQYGWDKIIKRMVNDGHQVASHTWSHADLSKITPELRKDEIIKLEMALRNILGDGYIPTYIRPPYSSCDDACKADLNDLGYHITYFDLDTDDYNRATQEKIAGAKDIFSANVTKADSKNDHFLAIAHDIQELTATELTESMLKTMQSAGFRGVTVGDCLGDPEENWYRGGSGKSSAAPSKVQSSAASASTQENSRISSLPDTTSQFTDSPSSAAAATASGLTPPFPLANSSLSLPSPSGTGTAGKDAELSGNATESNTDPISQSSDASKHGLTALAAFLVSGLFGFGMLW